MSTRTPRRPTPIRRYPPSVLEFHADTVPSRAIRVHGRAAPLPKSSPAPSRLATGPADQPFDFCGCMRRLGESVAHHSDELNHIDMSRILVAVTPARNGRSHGLQARVTPLRFRGGELTRRLCGVEYLIQRFRLDGREVLYLLTFCLPRYLNQTFEDKVVTLFHELYHISPAFDGDLRRHGDGRYQVHTHSQKKYDERMTELAKQYLHCGADPSLHAFLHLNFTQLKEKHGGVTGVIVPRPKLLPVMRLRATTETRNGTVSNSNR